MAVNLFQLHGVSNKMGPLLLEVDLKVLQLGLLHLLVQQRWWFLLLLHLQFSKKNDVLLQVQQPPLLHQLLHHLHIVEALFVTSVKVVDMLLSQCPSRRTMIINEQGEWEFESEPGEDAPRYDEDIKHDEGDEIQPDEGDNNCFVSR